MNTDLSSFNNSSYNPGSRVKRAIWYVVNELFFNSGLPFYGIKNVLLRWFGARIGKRVVIKPHVNIKYPWFLEIGDNSWIGESVWIDNLAKVTIGKNVCLSQGALILTGNHNYSTKDFKLIIKEIVIEDGVWIGARSVVCPGVTCMSHSVLSVGSIANSDLEAFSIYKGTPAEKIKERIIK